MTYVLGMPADHASAVASLAAVFVSLIALALAMWTAFIQRTHNRLSVRPLAEILYRDMEGHIKIKLCNNGTGPLIVKKLRIRKPGCEPVDRLLSAMPDISSPWTFFVGNVDGRSIRPGSSINLLELCYDAADSAPAAEADEVRKALQHLVVEVRYMDIYKTKLPRYRKRLEWFGRNL